MDELVDELSSAMIDVDNCGASNDIDVNSIQSNAESLIKSQKNHKPVTRSASILIRSKLLILSDSESDDDTKNRLLARKCKRINKKQNNLNKNLYTNERQLNDKLRLQMQLTYTGKRKRSSTIGEPNQSNSSITQMECDTAISETSSLSETSDDYDSDNNFDGDDEQSDFYEVIAKSKNNTKQRHHNHSRPIDFAVPSARNPFLTMGLSSSSNTSSYSSSLSSANMLWKRRRRMH